MIVIDRMLEDYPNQVGIDKTVLAECIAACLECSQACRRCEKACVGLLQLIS